MHAPGPLAKLRVIPRDDDLAAFGYEWRDVVLGAAGRCANRVDGRPPMFVPADGHEHVSVGIGECDHDVALPAEGPGTSRREGGSGAEHGAEREDYGCTLPRAVVRLVAESFAGQVRGIDRDVHYQQRPTAAWRGERVSPSASAWEALKMSLGAVRRLDDPRLMPVSSGHGFRDRKDAGRRLAGELDRFAGERPVVVAMARGGVPVAAEMARVLDAPLDVVVVRKISAPQHPEYPVGALAEGGVHVLNHATASALGLSDADVRSLIVKARHEISEQTRRYRGDDEPLHVGDHTVILVDDGLATGYCAQAAIQSLRNRGAERVILAVPVAAPSSVDALSGAADEIVWVEMPTDAWAVGVWYEDFDSTSEDEVAALLNKRRRHGSRATRSRDAKSNRLPRGAESNRLRSAPHI